MTTLPLMFKSPTTVLVGPPPTPKLKRVTDFGSMASENVATIISSLAPMAVFGGLTEITMGGVASIPGYGVGPGVGLELGLGVGSGVGVEAEVPDVEFFGSVATPALHADKHSPTLSKPMKCEKLGSVLPTINRQPRRVGKGGRSLVSSASIRS